MERGLSLFQRMIVAALIGSMAEVLSPYAIRHRDDETKITERERPFRRLVSHLS